MAKKKGNLSAFDSLLDDMGYGNTMSQPETIDVSDMLDNDGIENLDEPNDTSAVTEDVDNNEPQEPAANSNLDDDTEIPEDVINNTQNQSLGDQNTQTEESNDGLQNTEINETEKNNIGVFFDAFAEELGWDVDDDNKPTTVEGLVDYMSQVIEQNSAPHYADYRIAQLDEYVKNGGKFEDFYHRQQESVSYDNMDMEDESNQKAAIRDYLKYQGYTDDQISRKIERYEDGDLLEEEAEDAVTRLKQINEMQIAEQQKQQQLLMQQQEQQAAQFMKDLSTTVGSLTSIRGVNIPKQDRKALFDYITKTDENGLTRYQKDFNSNLVNNLIESAYFTMKGDALLGEAKRSGQTSAANKLRTMLRHQSTNHSRYNVNDNKQRSVVELASQFYR